MTDEELNKLQGLINSGSPTNWELVRLILESHGERDGLVMMGMFEKMIIDFDWENNWWFMVMSEEDVNDVELFECSSLGQIITTFIEDHYDHNIIPKLYIEETKAYDRFRENNKSD